MEQQTTTTTNHIAVFPFPFASHPIPLLHLTKRLATLSGPHVNFTFFNTASSNTAFFHSTNIPPNITAFDVPTGVPHGHEFVNRHYEEIEFYMKTSPESLRTALAESELKTGVKFTCVISDAFLSFAADIADEINGGGVPWIAVWTASEHALAAHVHTDLLRQKLISDGEEKEDTLINFIPGFTNVRVRDLPSGVVSGSFDTTFAQMLHRTGKTLPRAAAVVANTCDEFNPEVTADLRSICKRYYGGGPFSLLNPIKTELKNDPHNCVSWLDGKPAKSVVYIALGTSVRPSSDEITAIATALEETGVNFLWSLKTDRITELPDKFLDKIRESGTGLVVPWTPQVEVLSHPSVVAFMTHLGWSSLTESVGGGGVPMIGRPFFGDQQLNGRLVEAEWRVGVVVEGGIFTKDGVVKAFDKLKTKDGDEMLENAKRVRDMAKKAVGPGGSSVMNLTTLVKEILRESSSSSNGVININGKG